jgi:hypothetical protein
MTITVHDKPRSRQTDQRRLRPGRRIADIALAATVILSAGAPSDNVLAQPASTPAGTESITTGQLIDALVKSHVLTRAQVDTMLQKAQRDAAAPARPAPTRTARTVKNPPPGALAAEPVVPPGTVRVTYVPESTRQEIAADVKQQVMQEAQDEGWAAPNQSPDWVRRIRISGDVRLRGESDMFGNGNFNAFPNFNAINSSANGFDTNPNTNPNLPPILNTTENRVRYRVRARLDVAATVADWIDADIRIGTGNDSSPVSLNQTLGQPGDFSKYSLWLDRAYIKMHPTDYLTINAGRGPNPFWTTNLLYYDDLSFDGISAQTAYQFNHGLGGFLNLGAFPVFNTDFNFGTNNIVKNSSRDAYLFAAQGGGDWQINNETKAKLGVGYFSYSNVQGSQSTPCFDPVTNGSCDTDDSKPGFVQFGNTLSPLRNIVQDPSNPNGPVPQYFGLASGFRVLDVHGQVALTNYHPIDVVIDFDYVKNLAFKRSDIINRGPSNNLGSNNAYEGGDTGYLASISVGHQALEKLWDWNASVAYKYLETDAVLDALTDPDFHLGGTNAKGYILTANLGIAHNAYISAKFLSANQVSGPTYAADVLQIDLNAKF